MNRNIGKLMNRTLQIFANASNLPDTSAIEIADFYQEWKPGTRYQNGTYIKWGINERGRAQLYAATRTHNSEAGQSPDVNTQNYRALGISSEGVLYWIRPLDESDGYSIGDTAYYGNRVYESLIDGNIYEPGVEIPGISAWA